MDISDRPERNTIPDSMLSVLSDKEEAFLIVTGDYGAGAAGTRGAGYTASLHYLACVRLADNTLSPEKGVLSWAIPQEEWDTRAYVSRFERNTIYRITGRRYTNHNGIYVLEVLEKGVNHAALEEVLAAYHQETCIESAVFGKLVLDKDMDIYSGRGVWCGETVDVMLDIVDSDSVTEGLALLEQFFADAEKWDKQMRAFAAAALTGLANDWKDDAEWSEDDEESQATPPITQEVFAQRLQSPTVSMMTDGDFTVYYGDDDMFWGHVVTVYGNVATGIDSAEMEG